MEWMCDNCGTGACYHLLCCLLGEGKKKTFSFSKELICQQNRYHNTVFNGQSV